ncbi:YfhO family protein, partial [bacterium]|nr:YfhO family protein [bacterium]
QQQKSYVWKIATVLALLAIFTSVVAIFAAKSYFPIWKSMIALTLFPLVSIALIWKSMIVLTLLLLVSIAIIALRLKSKLPGKYFTTIAVVFIITNLWLCHMSFIGVKPTSEVYSAPPYVEYLQENSAGYRVYDPESIIRKNHLMVNGITEIDGYDATVLNYYSEFFGSSSGQIGRMPTAVPAAVGISSLGTKLGLLNAKYVLSSKPLTDNDFTLVYYYDDVYIYEYLKVLPKAFIIHKAEVITSEDDILTRLNDKEFNPKEYVILEDGSGNVALNNNGDFEEETIYRYSPNEIIVKTGSEHPGFLVIGEVWYPSWKVYVDGKLSQVLKTAYALMSVHLGSGNHTVQFVYDDQLFKIGIAISSATAIFLATIISIYVIRRRRAKS